MRPIEDLTTQCIRCGFCLEDCPTFVATSSELESPRGRIYLVRSALEGKLRWQEDVAPHLDRCLGCRACETACPSGVQYGAILEQARDHIATEKPNLVRKGLLATTTSPALLRMQLRLGGLLPGKRVPALISKLMSGQTAEADLPKPQDVRPFPPLNESDLPPVQGSVILLEGCAMRVLFPSVHAATRRLLRRVGYTVREVEQGCCGALHAHNGELDHARRLAANLTQAMRGQEPIIVNSAGCGSTMKEYGHLLGTNKAEQFARRVQDLSEFLLTQGLIDALSKSTRLAGQRVTYHDACHLSHGQKITSAPRQLIQAISGTEFVELPESLMCCGSAGIYNVTQPTMARTLLNRKVGHIKSTGATLVATGNPGCHAWIAQGCRESQTARVVHTAELLEAAFSGLD